MKYSGGLFERTGEGAMDIVKDEQNRDMQSVQHLEAVINEGLRIALMEETPDQSLEVLLAYLGKVMQEPISLSGMKPAVMIIPMNGWHAG